MKRRILFLTALFFASVLLSACGSSGTHGEITVKESPAQESDSDSVPESTSDSSEVSTDSAESEISIPESIPEPTPAPVLIKADSDFEPELPDESSDDDSNDEESTPDSDSDSDSDSSDDHDYVEHEGHEGSGAHANTSANIRSGAGTDSEIIGELNEGDEVKALGAEGDWFKISVNGIEGYVFDEYIS